MIYILSLYIIGNDVLNISERMSNSKTHKPATVSMDVLTLEELSKVDEIPPLTQEDIDFINNFDHMTTEQRRGNVPFEKEVFSISLLTDQEIAQVLSGNYSISFLSQDNEKNNRKRTSKFPPIISQRVSRLEQIDEESITSASSVSEVKVDTPDITKNECIFEDENARRSWRSSMQKTPEDKKDVESFEERSNMKISLNEIPLLNLDISQKYNTLDRRQRRKTVTIVPSNAFGYPAQRKSKFLNPQIKRSFSQKSSAPKFPGQHCYDKELNGVPDSTDDIYLTSYNQITEL